IKSLARDAKVLVLDEPTSVLTPQETEELMGIMKGLAKAGTSIVFITHKLREVQAVADRITVIRLGAVVGEAKPTDSAATLATMMVGRAVDLSVSKKEPKRGETGLSVAGLTVIGDRNNKVVDDVSFEVHAGEVLAIAGVQGNGQTELAEALVGLRTPSAGSIHLGKMDITHSSVRDVIDAGVGYIPEDRSKDGLVGDFTIAENFMINRSYGPPFAKGLNIDFGNRERIASQLIGDYDVRTPSQVTLAKNLSGGNQQKVVVARELSRDLNLLIASQPTRGVDVGSIEFIHERIIATRDAGKPVVIVSTELDEVTSLADRIAVMYRGRIVGIVDAKTSRETLGRMMAGATV
ncbi:MAG: ATP-binding cassette domain-containing protein, partial [Actinobacteria bacterium]|nr:ATP-binding cassette domain-containing protein [Actinomycetota bacterium]